MPTASCAPMLRKAPSGPAVGTTVTLTSQGCRPALAWPQTCWACWVTWSVKARTCCSVTPPVRPTWSGTTMSTPCCPELKSTRWTWICPVPAATGRVGPVAITCCRFQTSVWAPGWIPVGRYARCWPLRLRPSMRTPLTSPIQR